MRYGFKEGSRLSLHYLTAQLFFPISSESQLCSLESPEALKTLYMPGPTLRVFDLIALALCLKSSCFPSSPGDSDVQPELRAIKLKEA